MDLSKNLGVQMDGVGGIDEHETWGGRMADVVRDVAVGVFVRRVDAVRDCDGYFGFMREMWMLAEEVFTGNEDCWTPLRTVATTETHDVVTSRFDFDKYREALTRVAYEGFVHRHSSSPI